MAPHQELRSDAPPAGSGLHGSDPGDAGHGTVGLGRGAGGQPAAADGGRLGRASLSRFSPEEDPELRGRLERAKREAAEKGGKDAELVRAWHFFLLYNRERGVFGDRSENANHGYGTKTRKNPYALSRREWIEGLVSIENKRAKVVPFIFNQSQRNLEAQILRQARKGTPVRIVILKVRQNGISTQNLANALWLLLTEVNVKIRIITDREELCETLLGRVKRMFARLHKSDGQTWELPAARSNRDMIVLGEPFHSSIHVVSANTPNPGFGETNLFVDMEETSKWPDADEKGKGVELALPEVPGSYAFDVSQPKGNTGYFAKKFKRAWYRQLGLADPDATDANASTAAADVEVLAGSGWRANFIPWFLHEEYRWTKIGSNPSTLPDSIKDAIERTLTPEEKVLLQQAYHIRGQAPCKVDFDQLAWRRYYINEKCNGNLQTFHEQCPAFPEEAFLASGRPAFNIEHVQRAMARWKRPPVFIGTILENAQLADDKLGSLWIWERPVKGHQYAIGVDTAAGVRGGDPCVAQIVDLETDGQVAEWYGWEPPHLFGRTVKLLTDLYEAQAAIETHPSQHGLAVFMAAEEAGCKRLFVQEQWDSRDSKYQTRKGWIMSPQAKNRILDRVAKALLEENEIVSGRLLQEMLDMQRDERDQIERTCRNDATMAFGIALSLGDLCRTERRQAPKPEPLPRVDSDEAWWRERRLRLGVQPANRGRAVKYDAYNGQGL